MQFNDYGVFAVDKPQFFTSFDVVAKLRGILGIRRIGHGGTLDPLATGVLPIFVGKATKAVDLIIDNTKRYTATARFGISTDTGDITGEVTERSDVVPSDIQLKKVLETFVGDSMQIPPMYSAIKVNGRPLYDIARSGRTVERQERRITITSLSLMDFDSTSREFTIDVCGSKGTYIRVLAEDIARRLDTKATIVSLRRTISGIFSETDCLSLEDIQQRKEICNNDFILPIDRLFPTNSSFYLSEQQLQKFINGIPLPNDIFLGNNGPINIYYNNKMIALAEMIDGKSKTIARFI